MQALADDVDAARSGSGRLVVFSGPAGIGKTWLAEQALRIATDRGMPGVRTRCLDDEGVPALWPWIQLLRRLRVLGLSTAEDQPDLSASTVEADGAGARFRLHDAVSSAVVQASLDDGLAVVIEDLHWADEGTLQLLRHLAGEVASSRLLLVVTTREVAVAQAPLATVLNDVLRNPGSRLHAVPPFTPAETEACLRELSGRVPDQQQVEAVVRRTGGSPLLVGAVARALGRLPADSGSESDAWPQISEAADVGRLASSMTAQLDPDGRRVLSAAALTGEEIDPLLLAEVCRLPAERGHAALTAAATGGAVKVSGSPAGYRFAHSLIRDALAGRLDPLAGRNCTSRSPACWPAGWATNPTWSRAGPVTCSGPVVSGRC